MKRWIVSLLTIAGVIAIFPAHFFLSNNFHEVDPGKLYRSSQLTGEELTEVIEKYGIKSVVNLRGVNPHEAWYQEEVKVMQEKNIPHVSLKMNARRLPHKKDLLALLDSYETLPRPILIHCQGGSDRTGVADAIYRMEYMGQSKEEALKALSLKYYHFSWFEPAKKYFINAYQGKEWAKEIYEPCQEHYQFYNKERYCTPKKTSS